MTTAREIMHRGVQTVVETESVADAAQRMRLCGVGALPVCDAEGNPVGMVTDRDLVVKCLAAERDPQSTPIGAIARTPLLTVDTDAKLPDLLRFMEQNRIRRLPVTEAGELVGMITEADLARHLPEQATGHFVEAVSRP